jgi:hypothetical protein
LGLVGCAAWGCAQVQQLYLRAGWHTQARPASAHNAATTAGADGYIYNSTTGTFLFNVSYQGFASAEQACKDNGGHLASFKSEAEQAEVEAYYTSMGYMFPAFHRFYWMGLNTSAWPITGLPTFNWLDKSPGPDNMTYEHWGLWVAERPSWDRSTGMNCCMLATPARWPRKDGQAA